MNTCPQSVQRRLSISDICSICTEVGGDDDEDADAAEGALSRYRRSSFAFRDFCIVLQYRGVQSGALSVGSPLHSESVCSKRINYCFNIVFNAFYCNPLFDGLSFNEKDNCYPPSIPHQKASLLLGASTGNMKYSAYVTSSLYYWPKE